MKLSRLIKCNFLQSDQLAVVASFFIQELDPSECHRRGESCRRPILTFPLVPRRALSKTLSELCDIGFQGQGIGKPQCGPALFPAWRFRCVTGVWLYYRVQLEDDPSQNLQSTLCTWVQAAMHRRRCTWRARCAGGRSGRWFRWRRPNAWTTPSASTSTASATTCSQPLA